MYKIDLHTHSTSSPDGGISIDQYLRAIDDELLDCIAITDHNRIDVAEKLHKSLGNKIIVGEEISSLAGDIVGLFLTSAIRPGLSLIDTIHAIKSQGGIVYIPHPFETIRKGLKKRDLNDIIDSVDIVETYNGRAMIQNKGPQAAVWAKLHKKPSAASSDAHGIKGLGSTFTSVKKIPDANNLIELLSYGHMHTHRPPLRTLLYPKIHRLRNTLKKVKK
jgi:predicted metal-dependent phosphoesterase TrpH